MGLSSIFWQFSSEEAVEKRHAPVEWSAKALRGLLDLHYFYRHQQGLNCVGGLGSGSFNASPHA